MSTRSLDVFVATARELAARSGAQEVVFVLDRGEGLPGLTLWCPAGEPVCADGVELSETAGTDAAPLPLADVRAPGRLEIDRDSGELTARMGAVAGIAAAVRDLAGALPGRSVVAARFATSDPAAPLLISARAGERLELALGEEQFTMPVGWP